MRYLVLAILSAAVYSSELSTQPLVELDSGASRGVEYVINRETADPSKIILRLINRNKPDVRITYSIIPGAGDPIGDLQKTCIIKGDSSWPMHGTGKILCNLNKPGIRIDEIEVGTIEEEEGYYYDVNGNETRSMIYKFRPDAVKK